MILWLVGIDPSQADGVVVRALEIYVGEPPGLRTQRKGLTKSDVHRGFLAGRQRNRQMNPGRRPGIRAAHADVRNTEACLGVVAGPHQRHSRTH